MRRLCLIRVIRAIRGEFPSALPFPQERENRIARGGAGLTLSAFVLAGFKGCVPAPAVIEPGEFRERGRTSRGVVHELRDRLVRGPGRDRIDVVLAVQHLNPRGDFPPCAQDIHGSEFPEEPFASTGVRRRRGNQRPIDADAGHFRLCRQDRRENAAKRNPEKIDAIGIHRRMRPKGFQRRPVAGQLFVISDGVARSTLTVSHAGLLDAQGDKSLRADRVYQTRLRHERRKRRIDRATPAALKQQDGREPAVGRRRRNRENGPQANIGKGNDRVE
jgi:hypothetical protein